MGKKNKEKMANEKYSIEVEKRNLFAVVPSVKTPKNENDAWVTNNSDAYNNIFKNAIQYGATMLKETTHYPTLYTAKQCIHSLNKVVDNYFKSVKQDCNMDEISERTRRFIKNAEMMLKKDARNASINLIINDIGLLCYDAYMQALQSILETVKGAESETTHMGMDMNSSIFSSFISALSNHIDKTMANNVRYPSNCYDAIYSPFFKCDIISMIPESDKNDNNTQIRHNINKTMNFLRNVSINATLMTTQLYNNIYCIASATIRDPECIDNPLHQTFMAALDGFGVFHEYHEKIVSIFDYSFEIIKMYLEAGIIKPVSNEQYDSFYYEDF